MPNLRSVLANCDYCARADVSTYEPTDLRSWFEPVVDSYTDDADGWPLVKLMRDDWALFEGSGLADANAKELLADVLDDGEIVRRPFAPVAEASDSLDRWDELREELMHGNRWFLRSALDFERLGSLLSYLIVDPSEISSSWFRARLQGGGHGFSLGEMGPPPAALASHGRANPAGIPYLYVGSSALTGIAEVRPHTGDIASVARFELAELRAVDLRAPRRSVSPFILEDSSVVSQLRADLPLLVRLGDELTRPVLPTSAAFEYTPSQYLCEFIKSCNFDGVIYRSSVSEGTNLALFDPSKFEALDVESHRVGRVSIATDPVSV